jgi:hypothetical protein
MVVEHADLAARLDRLERDCDVKFRLAVVA